MRGVVAASGTSLALVLAIVSARPVWAEFGQAGASTEGDQITAEASYEPDSGSPPATGDVPRGAAPRASVQIGDVPIDAVGVGNGCAHLSSPSVPGVYARVCRRAFESSSRLPMPFSPLGIHYRVLPLEPPAPRSTPAASEIEILALRARESLVLPAPRIAMNPPAEWESVVGLATWLWVEGAWEQQSATASAGPVSAVVRARPETVVWDMGNGDRVTCSGPGTPYNATRPPDAQHTDCSYTYRRSSAGRPGEAFQVTATVVWRASWSAVGVEGGGDLGPLTTSGTVPIRVAELQALNT